MLSTLSSFPVRRPKAALGVWLVVLVAFIVLGSGAIDRLETVPVGDTNTDSQFVEDTLAELGASSPDVVALYDGIDITNPTLAHEVRSLDERLSGITHVSNVFHTFDEGPLFTSIDGQATIVSVVLDRSLPEAEFEELVETVEAELRSVDAPRTLVGGVANFDRESVEQTERDLQKAELITLPITLIAAIVVFGGVLAAMLPLAIALVAIPGSMFILWLLTLVTDVELFALNAATMLGLGLAIDYALLIVNRFREERALGKAVADAVTRTVSTAGVTVLFSGGNRRSRPRRVSDDERQCVPIHWYGQHRRRDPRDVGRDLAASRLAHVDRTPDQACVERGELGRHLSSGRRICAASSGDRRGGCCGRIASSRHPVRSRSPTDPRR
jgi:RND superfamily putative drug exporter